MADAPDKNIEYARLAERAERYDDMRKVKNISSTCLYNHLWLLGVAVVVETYRVYTTMKARVACALWTIMLIIVLVL